EPGTRLGQRTEIGRYEQFNGPLNRPQGEGPALPLDPPCLQGADTGGFPVATGGFQVAGEDLPIAQAEFPQFFAAIEAVAARSRVQCFNGLHAATLDPRRTGADSPGHEDV